MNKFTKSALVATSIFVGCSAQAATDLLSQLSPSTVAEINDNVGAGVNYNALNRVIDDALLINSSIIRPNLASDSLFGGSYYNSSSIAGTFNGHDIKAYTTDGIPLGKLAVNGTLLGDLKDNNYDSGAINKETQQASISNTLVVEIDGVKVFDGTLVDRANIIDLARILDILPALEATTSTSLASTSNSSASSQLVYGNLDMKVLSHKQKQAMINRPSGSIFFAMADLKYEQAEFTNNDDGGDIKGALMSLSTEVADVELGAYIPYDYMDFKSFSAHRTGAMLYAKRNWQLPSSLQLATMVNFNYMAAYVNDFSLTNTFGGGFGTSLRYDDGGDFVPSATFAFQYNQDDYYKADDLIKDNHQYLVKIGSSLGYRLFENATLQTGFAYTRDVTDYTSNYNQMKDNDYFDITFGGSYAIADMWQVNLNYKRILGLDSYYSNAVFLGTVVGF